MSNTLNRANVNHHTVARDTVRMWMRRLRPLALPALALLATAAYGANPLEEAAKSTPVSGGTDPHGNSWLSIQNSIQQFSHIDFVLRLFLSFSLSVVCAWVLTWHPRRTSLWDPVVDLEERKTIIILGLVGAIVAELAGSSPPLAFVIFGIGALVRFRTVLDNPKLTGKAITVVVIGLACGMGSWVMAVFVTAFAWLLLFFLESYLTCRVRLRINKGADVNATLALLQPLLSARNCRILRTDVNAKKGLLILTVYMPAGLEPKMLEADIRQAIATDGTLEVNIKAS